MKVKAEQLLPLVLDFIGENYGKKDLKAFAKYFDLEIDFESDPLVEAGGLKVMLESYLK